MVTLQVTRCLNAHPKRDVIVILQSEITRMWSVSLRKEKNVHLSSQVFDN